MSELDELITKFRKHAQGAYGIDREKFKQELEAYISKHYIKKEDVLEAIGKDEKQVLELTPDEWKFCNNCDQIIDDGNETYSDKCRCDLRNQLRAEIKLKLNLGDK